MKVGKFLSPFIPKPWIRYILIKKWEKEGKPVPPPHVLKQATIISFQKQFGINLLVETGTYLGDMIAALKNHFTKLISIELSQELHHAALKRFKKDKHVTLVYGDSGVALQDLVTKINEPAIFWLDGHYSGGITAMGKTVCPIFEELKAIFKSGYHHILLIDDARLFDGTNDYPTLEQLISFIKSKKSNSKITVMNDIIRVTY